MAKKPAQTNWVILDPDGWLVENGKDTPAVFHSLRSAKKAALAACAEKPGRRYTVYVSAATVEAVVADKDWRATVAC